MTLKVGLTGGIGSGKTTVATAFSDLGAPTFSADTIGHELSQPGELGYKEIVSAFGSGILNEDHSLNRTKLGDIIFNNHALKAQLENILHPLIMERMHQLADTCQAPYCILDIPLLINTDEQNRVDRILVVYSDIATRVQRVQTRNGWTEAKIRQVINEQLANATLIQAADDLIENNGEIVDIKPKVLSLHDRYLSFCN